MMDFIQFLWWLPMIVIAFANATLRELFFIKHLHTLRAHQVSTVTLVIMCSIYVYLIFPFLRINGSREALFVGITWVILTILFEFALGRLTKKSWSDLLQQYDIPSGHIWPVFLV